jgi:chromosomal replication initiation ATPase DnaA
VDLDRQLTFESFVVGPANRLASAASRRAADSPGRSFNPLFIYSSSGLGKTHLLTAIANQAGQGLGSGRVLYKTLESYLDDLEKALERGEKDVLRETYRDLDILLLDDVQFITGHPEAQEMLLGTLDALTGSGSQVVLASDRPPADIDDLDARLLSRFSGGLIVDIALPEYETRVAIVLKKVSDRGTSLAVGTGEAIARYPYDNIRELQGALNRVLAIQEIEEREVLPEQIVDILGPAGGSREGSEFASFVQELSATLETSVSDEEERLRAMVRTTMAEAEAEGFSAARLERLLQDKHSADEVREAAKSFRNELERLKEVRAELDRIGNPWPEAAVELLSNPDRLREAEALLASARERHRPFPALPAGPKLHELADRFSPLALRVAEQLITDQHPDYNPLYVWSADGKLGLELQSATGRTAQELRPELRIALISVEGFAGEFIESLSTGVAGAWRERWWTTDLLLLHGVEQLADTERAQEEFFHLFESLKRTGVRVLLSADRPPSSIDGIEDRLRTRFEGGLVLDRRRRSPLPGRRLHTSSGCRPVSP